MEAEISYVKIHTYSVHMAVLAFIIIRGILQTKNKRNGNNLAETQTKQEVNGKKGRFKAKGDPWQ